MPLVLDDMTDESNQVIRNVVGTNHFKVVWRDVGMMDVGVTYVCWETALTSCPNHGSS